VLPDPSTLPAAAGAGDTLPGEVVLNPIGQWVLIAAWAAIVAVNLWTWRLLLKPRRRSQEAS
jgi:hypothetical protein